MVDKLVLEYDYRFFLLPIVSMGEEFRGIASLCGYIDDLSNVGCESHVTKATS